ncbi:hypothetical protein C8D88_121101 [Lentzea atacamensis]|uniref:Uncharacterized protein n=1 Tax=Lentzea atacamensis TaxID=531938 RepID=A0A316HJT8_9PSEU|nr:hypothetical protein C8D88_121101 [Lentzea atacamensis]
MVPGDVVEPRSPRHLADVHPEVREPVLGQRLDGGRGQRLRLAGRTLVRLVRAAVDDHTGQGSVQAQRTRPLLLEEASLELAWNLQLGEALPDHLAAEEDAEKVVLVQPVPGHEPGRRVRVLDRTPAADQVSAVDVSCGDLLEVPVQRRVAQGYPLPGDGLLRGDELLLARAVLIPVDLVPAARHGGESDSRSTHAHAVNLGVCVFSWLPHRCSVTSFR